MGTKFTISLNKREVKALHDLVKIAAFASDRKVLHLDDNDEAGLVAALAVNVTLHDILVKLAARGTQA